MREMVPRLGNSAKLRGGIPPRTILPLALQAPAPTLGSVRTTWSTDFHQKSTYSDTINVKALCGTNLVTLTPESSLNEICEDHRVVVITCLLGCEGAEYPPRSFNFSTLFIESARRVSEGVGFSVWDGEGAV